jgi:two-component system, OmpR family, response regulator
MSNDARILVVDDEIDTLGLVELTLATAGYDVKTATGGEQALRLLRQESFDLVLLDIMMPDLSGFDVIRRLQDEGVALPAIVFLTAKNSPEDRQTGSGLGATGYLVKPTTRGQLMDTIRAALERSAG